MLGRVIVTKLLLSVIFWSLISSGFAFLARSCYLLHVLLTVDFKILSFSSSSNPLPDKMSDATKRVPISRLPQPVSRPATSGGRPLSAVNDNAAKAKKPATKPSLPRCSSVQSSTTSNKPQDISKKTSATKRPTASKRPSSQTALSASTRLYKTSTTASRSHKDAVPSTYDIEISIVTNKPNSPDQCLSPRGQNTISERMLEQARKSGQLLLQNRNWTEIPPEVWTVNERTERQKQHGLTLDMVPDFDADPDAETEAWWNQKLIAKLSLANNLLTQIPSDLSRFHALLVLDLAYNNLESLCDAVGECTRLQRLILSHNNLHSLPESLGKLTDLILLKSDHNQLKRLPDSFVELCSLEEVDLAHNRLETLPDRWLNGLHLRKLLLAHNNLQELPSEIGWLQQLHTLDVSDNRLGSHLCPEIGELTRLELLYLHGNRLETMPVLKDCAQLKELYLGANRIVELEDEFFRPVPGLKVADLHDNKLKRVPDSLCRLSSLERLNLERNDLSSIAPEVALIPTLKSLSLKDNPLRTIRRDIVQRGASELIKYLKGRVADAEVEDDGYLSSSGGASFPKLADVIRSRRLDLSGRNLNQIPDSILEPLVQKDVYHVNLAENQLTQLPTKLYDWGPTLTELNAAKNQFSCLSAQIAGFKYLSVLQLNVNQLTDLPSELANCEQLRELDISHNRFLRLPDPVLLLTHLEVLHASNNKIVEIPAQRLVKLTALAVLNLSSNEIITVPPELGKLKLKSLQLEGNAFRVPRAATLAKGTAEVLSYLRGRLPSDELSNGSQ